MKILAFDGGIHRFLEKIFDLMILNLLWILTSLPLFTIGAASSALYSVTLRMSKNEEGSAFKSYRKAFKENFRASTLLWTCFVLVIGWLVLMIRACLFSEIVFLKLLALLEAAILVLVISALLFVFALQARYENTMLRTIQN